MHSLVILVYVKHV